MAPRDGYPRYSSQAPRQGRNVSISSYGSTATGLTALTAFSVGHAGTPHAAGGTLPCGEFSGYHNCHQSFAMDDFETWIQHTTSEHLDGNLPRKAACWFCDEIFKCKGVSEDRGPNFRQRMLHIRDHLAEGWSTQQIRVDHHMNEHLWKHRLIPQELYLYVQRYSEIPQDGTIYPLGTLPPPLQDRQMRRDARYIDQHEDDRRYRRDRARGMQMA